MSPGDCPQEKLGLFFFKINIWAESASRRREGPPARLTLLDRIENRQKHICERDSFSGKAEIPQITLGITTFSAILPA